MTDWWTGYPWRMIQTNLREIDMRDIDADRYVADLQAFKATVVLINTAGIIASYPTALPYHFQSPYLQGSSLQEIIAACHRTGIRVLARTDFSKVRRPIYEQYPEWAYLTAQGQIVDYNGDIHVCLNSDYQQHYALEIMREVVTTHDFDGIFFNMGGYQVRDYSGNYYGPCHCARCQARFREMYGLALPKAEDTNDPTFRKYNLFRRRTLREHHDKVYTFLRDLRPDLCVANHLEFRRGLIRQESNTAIGRALPHWQYSGSENTKWAVSSYPEMVSTNTSVDFIDFPYRHVAVSPEQQALRLAQGLANGGAIDYYLIGRLDNHADRSGYAPVQCMFHYHAAHEDVYRDLTSRAEIALLNGAEANQGEFRGWFRFLVEHHYPFDTLMVDAALDLDWNKYRSIIVPDYQPLSDALAARLDAFAQAGGTVIATARAGFRDADNEPRPAPALRCLGIETVRTVRAEMTGSYLQVTDKAAFPRLADTDLLYLDGPYVYADYAADAARHLTLIPPQPFGPPERCYPSVFSDHPGLIVHSFGQGRGLYLPWAPGALFQRQGYVNTFAFVGDLLERVAGLEPVGGNLSPMVEVTRLLKRDGSAELVHLVNTSGHFGVTFYPAVPMADVEVALPHAPRPSSVRGLVTGQDLPWSHDNDQLTIRIPHLDLFEAIEIK